MIENGSLAFRSMRRLTKKCIFFKRDMTKENKIFLSATFTFELRVERFVKDHKSDCECGPKERIGL
jgi:hypothetical protein